MFLWSKIRKLGQGSFGRVDLARHQWSDDDLFAVKSTTLENRSSLEQELRFLNNFRGDPHVVQSYGDYTGLEEDGSTRYNVVLELAPYGTLHNLIHQNLDESTVAYYAFQLLRGLSSVHRQGIVHCDIKPCNILVFESYPQFPLKIVKLADFGLARYEWEREPGIFRGTHLYGSPEAVMKGLHGKATDIWSLGMTVLEMLYRGKPMRDGSLTASELMALTAHRGPPEIPAGVSETCRDFLNKCLQMKAEDRPSADQLLNHDFIRGNLPKPYAKRSETSAPRNSNFSKVVGPPRKQVAVPVTPHRLYQLFP